MAVFGGDPVPYLLRWKRHRFLISAARPADRIKELWSASAGEKWVYCRFQRCSLYSERNDTEINGSDYLVALLMSLHGSEKHVFEAGFFLKLKMY